MIINDTVLFDVADELLQCAATALDERTTAGAPDYQAVVVGLPAHDNCCAGQLTVSLVRQYASGIFPEEDTTTTPCGPPYTVLVFDVEIIRCAPTLDGLGNFPDYTVLTEAARLIYIDAQAVWAGIACCLKAREYTWNSSMRNQEMITPDGGCHGSRLRVYVGLTNGCGCE